MAAVRLGAELLRRRPTAIDVSVPTYDRRTLRGGIVHLGVGGFHRAHLASYVDQLAERHRSTWSITGSGVMAHDQKIADVLEAQDCLYTLIEREGDTANARVVGSITGFAPAHTDTSTLRALLESRDTRIVSLTITESGYPVQHGTFAADDALLADVTSAAPRSTFGIIAAALDRRRLSGLPPFTVLSCDNLPGNGNVTRLAVLGVAACRSTSLASWLIDHGAFPNSMVDRITPATTDADRRWCAETFGIEDGWPVVCEPFCQWALEDHFADGRPAFESVGVLMTEDSVPYEQMKLRLLNAGHSALAYHAALAGITFVHDATRDPRINTFIRSLMKNEAAPNLRAPVGIDLPAYQDMLVRRFSNPAIGDTIARLCMDGTSKFPTFLVPSIEAQLANGGSVAMLALATAGWCRYLQGRADDGSTIVHAHDPYVDEARAFADASRSEPQAFLGYRRALGPNIASSDRFADEFADALRDLEAHGSLATLARWTDTTGTR